MARWLAGVRARLHRWIWGDPNQRLPNEVRDAAYRVVEESLALQELVDRLEREKRWGNR